MRSIWLGRGVFVFFQCFDAFGQFHDHCTHGVDPIGILRLAQLEGETRDEHRLPSSPTSSTAHLSLVSNREQYTVLSAEELSTSLVDEIFLLRFWIVLTRSFLFLSPDVARDACPFSSSSFSRQSSEWWTWAQNAAKSFRLPFVGSFFTFVPLSTSTSVHPTQRSCRSGVRSRMH